MQTYLINLWDKARSSYWFAPGLIAMAALALSIVMPRVDQRVIDSETDLPEWVRTTTDTARVTLSALGGAMITVTGTVFSITIVTLSLTSQQFGPRLLRRFMHDLTTQVTLGVFLSTGFYCLLVLRVVENHEDGLVAPHLSVLLATVLTVLSMLLLIVYIHHVAMMIQAPSVVASVAADLNNAIDRMFPERIGDPLSEAPTENQPVPPGEGLKLRSEREGYVQAIAGEALMSWARDKDLVVRLLARPGSFLAPGSVIAEVWRRRQGGEPPERLADQINDMLIVGDRRTPRQDIECAVDELVEVAVRALSPGVNDPFTAVNCVDRLGASLGRLAERRIPDCKRYDADGELRVIAHPIALANLLEAAFNQIRQYGRGSAAVTIRLLEALASIAARTTRAADRDAIRAHAEMIVRGAESLPEGFDKRGVRERYDRVLATLNER